MALIKCPECGKTVSDKADKCLGCGYPLVDYTSNEERTACPFCGAPISSFAAKCEECGNVLKIFGQEIAVPYADNKFSSNTKPKWATGKLVIGIISLVLFLIISLQSCAVGISNTLTDNGERSGSYGFWVALFFMIGGILSIVLRNAKTLGGPIATCIFYYVAFIFSCVGAGSYSDLRIWGVVSFCFGLISILSGFKDTGKIVITLVLSCILFLFYFSSGSQSVDSHGVNDNTNAKTKTQKESSKPVDDFSDVEKVYELTAGFYTAGIDLPSGRCNVAAVSGTGNLMSTNMYNGGVNEMFGVDDGTGLFSGSFNGLKMPEGTTLSTNGRLVIRLEYTSIEGRATGRSYDEDSAFELGGGNYVSGTDFPAGVYTIEAVSGAGNLLSSNMYDGGVNEIFGTEDSNFYNNKVKNVDLPTDTELTVSGGLQIKLVPCK